MMKRDPAVIVVLKYLTTSRETQRLSAINAQLKVPLQTELRQTCSECFPMVIDGSSARPSSNGPAITVPQSPRVVTVPWTTILILIGFAERFIWSTHTDWIGIMVTVESNMALSSFYWTSLTLGPISALEITLYPPVTTITPTYQLCKKNSSKHFSSEIQRLFTTVREIITVLSCRKSCGED